MSGTLKYRVVARRVTIYEVEAANAEEAEQTFTDKDEVDGNTQEIWAVALCPECTEPLTNRTRREYQYRGGGVRGEQLLRHLRPRNQRRGGGVMPRIITRTLYQFSELDDRAKENARTWYRHLNDEDNDFADCVIEDAVRMAEILGITIDHHPVKLMNGSTRQDPSVWWGLHTQGSGACFSGHYAYAKGAHRLIRKEAPQDLKLHDIADNLMIVQQKYGYKVTATITTDSRAIYSGSTGIEVSDGDYSISSTEDGDEVRRALRSFMDWIYDGLNAEYDSRQTDEYVDEMISNNEYEFTKHGQRADGEED